MPDAVMNGAMRTNARRYFMALPPQLVLRGNQIREIGKRHDGDQINGSTMLILIG